MTRGNITLTIDPKTFAIMVPTYASKTLRAAIQTYQSLLFPLPGTAAVNLPGSISSLEVTVVDPTEYPPLNVDSDETYSLQVTDGNAILTANELWGALKGLETFSQLIDFDVATETYAVGSTPVNIQDSPRFAWRGLLIDSARHYLEPATIMHTIDAMAYNKLNVLHWHLVDAQSFPLQIPTVPDLANKGAYHPKYAVYTPAVVKDIVAYGYSKGVRVLPEIDAPGHAYSWKWGQPAVVSTCPTAYATNVNNWPLDPSNNATFQVLQEVWAQVQATFLDDYVHVGGDEVVYPCWTGNPTVAAWMAANGFTTGAQVLNYFMSRVFTLVPALGKKMVCWEDLFNAKVTLPSDIIVQIWSGAATLQKVVSAGLKTINAYGWYLDKQQPYPAAPLHYEWIDTWQDFYNYEPTANVTGDLSLVLGGEAAMWGEQVDSAALDERVWPRAAAVGERLWSPKTVNVAATAALRLNPFRCVMARRGIRGGPIAPNYCPLNLVPATPALDTQKVDSLFQALKVQL